MSGNVDLKVLETFMARARTAARTGSKELRVPSEDCLDLVAAIGYVLAQNVSLSNRLKDTQSLLGGSIRIDGGGFDRPVDQQRKS